MSGARARLVALAVALGACLAPASAAAEPVVIPNDAPPAEQFNVSDPDGVVDELHAHGGGMLRVGEWFYWFGEWRGASERVAVYRSRDLKNWEYRGIALGTQQIPDELASPNIERPKVIYNAQTGKYVMWMHLETNNNYNRAEAAVAVADDVEGPYAWHSNFRPSVSVQGAAPNPQHPGTPHMSRDITAFVDDDGTAYMISAADDNRDLHVYKLNEDYTGFAASGHYLVWNDQWREAPIVFKRNGTYFMLISGATGWAPNQQTYATATSMAGPWTQPSPLPLGNGSTYESQGAHAIAIQGTEGTSYLYLGDRWGGSFGQGVMSSRYVWLPLEFPTDRTLELNWADAVRIDTETGEVEGVRDPAPEGRRLAIANVAVGSTSGSAPHPFLHGTELNPPADMTDGRMETAWVSGNGVANAWARFDLGAAQRVDTARLQFYRGGIRSHPIAIDAGPTPEELTEVWSGTLEHRTGFHTIAFDPVRARYLRVRLTGASTGDTNQGIPPGESFGLVEAEFYESGEAPPCVETRSDDFADGELDTERWDFRHPTTPADGPHAPAVRDGALELFPLAGTLDEDESGPIAFVGQPLPEGEHWAVTAKLTFEPTAGAQSAGLMLWAGDDDFVRVGFERVGSGGAEGQRYFQLVTERGGVRRAGPVTHQSAAHPDTVWLRLQRAGDRIIARYATTQGNFFTNAGMWLPRDAGTLATFNGPAADRLIAGLDGPAARVGPYASGSPDGVDELPPARFEVIEVTPDPKRDTQPPTTQHELDLAPGAASLSFTADDGECGAGVERTEYSLDGGAFVPWDGAPLVVAEPGYHQVIYRSLDRAGNRETLRSVGFEVEEPPVTPVNLRLKLNPRSKAVKPGRKRVFKVAVRPRGDAPVPKGRLCVKAPHRFVKVAGKRCRALGTLAPERWTRAKVRVAAKRKAAGKRVRVTFIARAAKAEAAKARAVLKVKR